MIIAHIADIHCRNYIRHEEYRTQFDKLYVMLREKNVDAIVVAGDIVHSKLQISPELVDLVGSFFKSLASIAPTHILPGNHDGNIKNISRLDALTPIVNNIECDSLFYHKESCVFYPKEDESIALGIYSMFDTMEPDPQEIDDSYTKIALYHGSVYNAYTDSNFKLSGIPLSYFNGWDIVLLGDIHQHQYLNEAKTIAYCGSLMQQNFGEKKSKGFMIWDTTTKESEFIELQNDWGFETIRLDESLKLPRVVDSKYPRIRVITDNLQLTSKEENNIRNYIRQKFNPLELKIIHNKLKNTTQSTEVEYEFIKHIRDENVQHELLSGFVQSRYGDVDDSIKEKVYNIDELVSSKIPKMEITRNVKWDLNKFEWSNLFCYGEDNYIDFEKLNGIIGVFGDNASGKSSIIDSLLYTMFNSTTRSSGGGRGSVGNSDIVNKVKDFGAGEITATIDGKKYKISRHTLKSNRKKRDGSVQETVRTDVEYSVKDKNETKNLNGEQRNQTDKAIRQTFGSIDDFMTTSLSAQHDSLNFINKSPRERKEVLGRFLDLGVFDEKFIICKDVLSSVKSQIKSCDANELNIEIDKLSSDVDFYQNKENQLRDKIKTLNECCELKSSEIKERYSKMHNVEIVDIELIESELIHVQQRISAYSLSIDEISEKLKDLNSKLVLLEPNLEKEKNKLLVKEEALDVMMHDNVDLQKTKSYLENKICNSTALSKNLTNIPEPECLNKSCYFISDAQKAEEGLGELKTLLSENKIECSVNDPFKLKKEVEEQRALYESVAKEIRTLKDLITEDIMEQNGCSSYIDRLTRTKDSLMVKKDNWTANKLKIEENKIFMVKIDKSENKLESLKTDRENIRKDLEETLSLIGWSKKSLEESKNKLTVHLQFETKKKCLEIYQHAMSRDGIQKNIIRKNLPVLNNHINKILTNVVDFNIFIEDNDDLDIYIEYDSLQKRPMELGSGMEKMLASIAIRVSLIMLTNLPKPTIFIVDEGFGALDSDNLTNIRYMFEYIKNFFKNILIITHIDSVKDIADHLILIEKDSDGCSKMLGGT